jgi:hypothetical protein
VVPLESYGESQKIIRAKINDREGTFLFDSGGGVTTITPEFATEIGRKPWRKIVGFRMTGQRLDMARRDDVMLEIAGTREDLSIVGVFETILIPKRFSGSHLDEVSDQRLCFARRFLRGCWLPINGRGSRGMKV